MRQEGHYLITTMVNGKSWKTFWDASEPFELDYPCVWRLVKKGDDLFVLNKRDQALNVDSKMILAGRRILLPPNTESNRQVKLQVRKLKPLPAAYMPVIDPRIQYSDSDHFISSGMREALIRFQAFRKRYEAHVEKTPVFSLEREGENFILAAQQKKVRFKIEGQEWTPILLGVKKIISPELLTHGTIFWRSYWWRINSVPTPQLPSTQELEEDEAEQDATLFKIVSRSVVVVCLVLAGIAKFWMKQEEIKPVLETRVELKKPKIIPKVFESPKPPAPTPSSPPKVIQRLKPPEKPKPKVKRVPPKRVTPREKKIVKKLVAPIRRVSPKRPDPVRPPSIRKVPSPPPLARPLVPVAPKGPPPAVVQRAQERASVAKSLSFLSKSFGKPIALNTVQPNAKLNARYSQVPSAKVTSSLSRLDTSSSIDGPISTRGARSLNSNLGFKGSKFLNDVQGRVALSALYRKGSGEAIASVIGNVGMNITGPGSLSDAAIEKTLAKYLQRFQYCYEKALLSNPSLSGNVQMQWIIQVGGGVSGAKVVQSDMNSQALNKCLSVELSKIVFPSPKGGAVEVKKPFHFSSRGL